MCKFREFSKQCYYSNSTYMKYIDIKIRRGGGVICSWEYIQVSENVKNPNEICEICNVDYIILLWPKPWKNISPVHFLEETWKIQLKSARFAMYVVLFFEWYECSNYWILFMTLMQICEKGNCGGNVYIFINFSKIEENLFYE